MKPFAYERADNPQAAMSSLASSRDTKLLGGGTNLIDLMKNDVEQPTRLVDIQRLEFTRIESLPGGGLRIGALARNSDTANHPLVRQHYPLLAQAILSGASPQLRNMATDGGNLMQRTRCYYFYDTSYPACNKRAPGTGCAAIDGFNRLHAIFGASDACIATNPSDMCVALNALDATVRVQSAKGERTIPMNDFHRLPGNTPQDDTNLRRDEMIVAIDLPPSKFAEHSHYLKVRDRNSYAFALVSVAAALEMEGDTIRDARIALGGVAHKPWRSVAAEKMLIGAKASDATFNQAAVAAQQGAHPYKYNAFKVELVKQSMMRALKTAGRVA